MHPGQGCALAALGGELAREERDVRRPAWRAMQHLWEGLAPYVGGDPQRAMALCAAMVGGMASARLAPDAEAADAMLADLRAAYGQLFAPVRTPRRS